MGERSGMAASLQILKASFENYVNVTWQCLDDSVSRRIDEAQCKTTDVLSKMIDGVGHKYFEALEAVRNDISATKASDADTLGAGLRDVCAQLDTMSRDLRALETLESWWEERLAEVCEDTHFKVA